MSINNVIGILSSPVSSPVSSYPIPSTYLTKLLPDDVLLIIASFTGPSFINLALTSKSICESIDLMGNYFMSSNYKNIILPLCKTALISTIIHLHPSCYKNWSLSRTTFGRELVFSNAVKTEPISVVKHIMSLGVNINCNHLIETHGEENDKIFPIHCAVYSNNPEKLRLLLDYGAIIPPLIQCLQNNEVYDLFSYTSDMIFPPIEVNKEIPEIILNEHIKQRDFSLFFERRWRSDIRVFKWFCDALSSIPRGLETGCRSICDNVSCGHFRDNLRICNGLFLCQECTTSSEGPGKEPLNEGNYIDKLWLEPSSYMYYEYYNHNDDDYLDWDHDEYDQDEEYHDEYDEDHGEDYDEKYGRYDKFERESFNRQN